jgi:cytochrome P450
MRPQLEAIANRIVDEWIDAGRCDLTLDFSHQYSIEALCTLIGVPPADIPVFAKATLEIVHLLSVPFERTQYRLAAGLEGLRNYSEDLVAYRRSLPEAERPDDFITKLIEAEDDDRLIGDELIWGIANLLFAGHDTTRYQMVSCLRGLMESGQWEEVATDPGLAPAAVEEGMRLYGVVNFLSREVTEDVELEGLLVPAGTVLCLNMLACARDPQRFDDPDRFDLHRELGRRIPFGHGLRKCLGDQLARLEMEIAVEVLTRRLGAPRLAAPIRMTPWTQGIIGAEEFVIEFEPRDPAG